MFDDLEVIANKKCLVEKKELENFYLLPESLVA